jgi:hypothetical protein
MTSLFGRGFEERAALQRRQIYHQRLLEAQSFKYEPHPHDDDIPAGAKAEFQGHPSDSEAGIFGLIALGTAVLLVALSYGGHGVWVSAVAALPAGALLMLATKWLSGDWGPGFGRAFTTSFIGIFSYLAVTVVIGFCVNLFHEPVAHPRFGTQLAGAIVELRGLSLTSWPTRSVPLLTAALATLHGPGLLVCARVLARRIEQPYEDGFRGLLIAWAVSLTVMPIALLATFWATKVLNVFR